MSSKLPEPYSPQWYCSPEHWAVMNVPAYNAAYSEYAMTRLNMYPKTWTMNLKEVRNEVNLMLAEMIRESE